MTYTNGKLTASVGADMHSEKGWQVLYTLASGRQCLKLFPSKRAAQSWAKGFVNDAANQ